MSEHEPNQPISRLEYFRVLRSEIVEAQKLRIQVGLAKTVFLGTLLGFFFKDRPVSSAILVCPFVALMFDCMVYGLSFNIRDIGTYIGEQLEGDDPRYEGYRLDRERKGYIDWGRRMFRLGNYGLSASVVVISFFETTPTAGTRVLSIAWLWRFAMILFLAFAWGLLLTMEFPKADRRHNVHLTAMNGANTCASDAHGGSPIIK